jgi:SAM-dependent methyltransferase
METSKQFYDEAYKIEHKSNYGGDSQIQEWESRIKRLWSVTSSWLESSGLNLDNQVKILEVGCGLAYLHKIHPGYTGIEYSKSAVERVKLSLGENFPIFEGDAQSLPFPAKFFSGAFTWAVIEHVRNPEKAFDEIDRVLVDGGYALIAPAWHCRTWTVKKLKERPYKDLSLVECVEKFLIPIKSNFLFRALYAMPIRLARELFYALHIKQKLSYKKLYPDWNLIEEYGHISDDDALSSIDIHSAIIYFLQKGYTVKSHNSLFKRLKAGGDVISVQKN